MISIFTPFRCGKVSRISDSETNSGEFTFIFHIKRSTSLGLEECLERIKFKSNAPCCKHHEVKNVLLHHGVRERSSDKGNSRGHVTRPAFLPCSSLHTCSLLPKYLQVIDFLRCLEMQGKILGATVKAIKLIFEVAIELVSGVHMVSKAC